MKKIALFIALFATFQLLSCNRADVNKLYNSILIELPRSGYKINNIVKGQQTISVNMDDEINHKMMKIKINIICMASSEKAKLTLLSMTDGEKNNIQKGSYTGIIIGEQSTHNIVVPQIRFYRENYYIRIRIDNYLDNNEDRIKMSEYIDTLAKNLDTIITTLK